MKKDGSNWEGLQTKAIHTGDGYNTTRAVSPPIWQTSTFRADTAEDFAEAAAAVKPTEFYTRYGNPTHQLVEATIAALESGESAIVTGSGMGAIFASVMNLLKKGDHVVAQRCHYAGATTLLRDYAPQWGIECTFVDQTDINQFAEAVQPNTKLIYIETPSNPLMQLTDIKAVAELAKRHEITTVIDNTFATPVNQRPIELGIDVVIHSATKYLGGHNDVTAGIVVGSKQFIEKAWKFGLVSGSILSPFDGWLLLRGLKTLGLRVERHNRNAAALAEFLESHPKVERVYYPGLKSHSQHDLARKQMSGFTGIMSVDLKGGFKATNHFIESLRIAKRAASLGGIETLIVHPASMWSLQLKPEFQRETGISEGLVRISVGIEDERDLIGDFARALEE